MKEKIYKVLNDLGVQCHLKGRGYLEDAIEYVYEHGEVAITKELYPYLAQKK